MPGDLVVASSFWTPLRVYGVLDGEEARGARTVAFLGRDDVGMVLTTIQGDFVPPNVLIITPGGQVGWCRSERLHGIHESGA